MSVCDTAVAVETPSPLSAAPLDTRLETGLVLEVAAALLEADAETDEPADWTEEVADEGEAVVSALGDAVETVLSSPRLRLELSSLDGNTVVTTVKIPSVIAV